MKQSAAKTLGVAALGAAFAAAAAGTASASALPSIGATDALPLVAGAAESLTHQQAAQEGQQSDPGQAVGQVTGLLGGLPLPLGG
ncbi:hypothetical protein [Streptomyces sp. NPDC012888]|uniref:hypothetical protein n=1 Tax=Streptomyces sp. NPDC012888 TaxID=3364855 RepID=UPI0036C7B515